MSATIPAHYGVAIFAFFFGINGIWLAHRLFWPQRPEYFWFTAGAIMLAIGCLIVMGAAESIARWLWPLALDQDRAQKLQQQAACDKARQLGLMLIMGPVLLILVPVWLLKLRQQGSMEKLAILLLFMCITLLYASPFPEKLARLVLPEDALKVPSHCAQSKP